MEKSLQQALCQRGLVPGLPEQAKKSTVNQRMLPQKKYRYRGRPCSILPDDKLWCVSGRDLINGGGGVLEWCYDGEDAKHQMMVMRLEFPEQFADLLAHKFVE